MISSAWDINLPSTPTLSLFCSCVCFCLYCPLKCISFHKFSRQLSVPSLCSCGFISALLVLSTIYVFMKVSFSYDVIPSGLRASNTNELPTKLSSWFAGKSSNQFWVTTLNDITFHTRIIHPRDSLLHPDSVCLIPNLDFFFLLFFFVSNMCMAQLSKYQFKNPKNVGFFNWILGIF